MTHHHQTPEYLRISRKVRIELRSRIDAGSLVLCVDCGRPVMPGQLWDVAHIIPASKGGTLSRSNLGASHRRCNRKAGGRLGAAQTNTASRSARRLPSW